jgi:uncharacterized membrane protein YphA (DoxX/SURF4 family)
MLVLALVARLALFWVFVLAAIAKLGDLRGSREAAAAFGVPGPLTGFVSWAVPVAELTIGGLLLPGGPAWWAAAGAMALLTVFSAGIAANLMRGHTPVCNCFGGYSTRPISGASLIRNGVFMALALAVILPGRGVPQLDALQTLAAALGMGPAGVAVVAGLTMLVVGQAIFLVQLFKQHGRLLVRLDEVQGAMAPRGAEVRPEFRPLGLGEPAPPFALPTLDGGAESSESLRAAGKPVVLIFAETTCPACAQMLGDAGRWQREFAGEATVAVVTSVRDRGMRRSAKRHGLSRVLLQSAHETAGAYRIEATPAAVTVDVEGRIASVPALGRDEIAQLIRQTADAERAERRAADAETLRLIPSAAEQRRTRGSAS